MNSPIHIVTECLIMLVQALIIRKHSAFGNRRKRGKVWELLGNMYISMLFLQFIYLFFSRQIFNNNNNNNPQGSRFIGRQKSKWWNCVKPGINKCEIKNGKER